MDKKRNFILRKITVRLESVGIKKKKIRENGN